MDGISKTSEELRHLKVESRRLAIPLGSIDLRKSVPFTNRLGKQDYQSYPDTGESGEAYDAEALMNSDEHVLS